MEKIKTTVVGSYPIDIDIKKDKPIEVTEIKIGDS